MEIKTPIAELHAKETRIGHFDVQSNRTFIYVALGFALIIASYFLYQYFTEDKKEA